MRAATFITFLTVSPVHAGEIVAFSATDFDGADIVIVGEIHDDPIHHQAQADIIALLDPTAIVFEMLTSDQAGQVTSDTINSSDLGELLEWEANGWPDFDMYAPIFAAAEDAKIIGAAPSPEMAAQARDDILAAFTDQRFELHIPLDEDEQRTREQGMQDGHCGALPAEILPWFVDQQRFRDAVFARAALEAFETFGGPVVVITGNGHAHTDWGMPVYLHPASPDTHVLSIGQITAPSDTPPYDLWRVTPPIDRPDPCAAFE